MTDPIADMLTRLRNALSIRAKTVEMPHSRVKEAIASVLKEEHYIEDYTVPEIAPKTLMVRLKYVNGSPAITKIRRVSKPGRRIYCPANKIPRSLSGYGSTIMTTSQGIMSDKKARNANAGGEILCEVY